ncbi:hypothetical protein BP5796_06054 [Coleophoma crateriformis]|uniref:Small secreted protein n=1 Tax=Coleophoma crateriformis TaxID=565419 RepID=A0A3D8RVW0_9HELO|nr:hypothetical protein BP5796_06054 [Coleophoma crateriformis]
MAVLKKLLATVIGFSSLAFVSAQTYNPAEFCTDAYNTTDGVAEGTGFCAAIPADIGVCHTFADFPEDSALAGNLSFVYIPAPYTYHCNLYQDASCSDTAYYWASAGHNDLTISLGGYNDNVDSWLCIAS